MFCDAVEDGRVRNLRRKKLEIRGDPYALTFGAVSKRGGELFAGRALFPQHGDLARSEQVTRVVRQEAALSFGILQHAEVPVVAFGHPRFRSRARDGRNLLCPVNLARGNCG